MLNQITKIVEMREQIEELLGKIRDIQDAIDKAVHSLPDTMPMKETFILRVGNDWYKAELFCNKYDELKLRTAKVTEVTK